MKKTDITKTIIKVKYTFKDRRGVLRASTFPHNLQKWIQKTPEQQEKYVAQHTKNKIITFDVI